MRNRVFTYITQGSKLLVLDYVDHSYLEPQIPGGTIESGESPEEAALREAQEETGLSRLKVVSFLGSFTQDLQAIGRDETIKAWFFHLESSDSTPKKWKHTELDSHEGLDPIIFELYWVPLDAIPKLGGIDNDMLPKLAESVAKHSH
ncbi:MAG: NUDIX domain-containing protein [Pseudomonadota bacterium]|nr:NUDIX domain-containing protein [Pseudomonadota bacterium]